MYETYISTELQEVCYLCLQVRTSSNTLILCVDNNTVVAEEANRTIVLCFVITTRSREIVVLLQTGTCHHIKPVNVLTLAVIVLAPYLVPDSCTIVLTGSTDSLGIFVNADDVKVSGSGLQTPVGSNVNIGLTLCSVLCGNHNNAVCTSCTVNGGSGSILQNLNALNIRWIKEVGICTNLYTVNNIKRIRATVNCGNTTDANLCIGIRSTVLHLNHHTRSSTLQSLSNV